MSEADRPLPCRWDGEHLVPLRSFAKAADHVFVIGEVYPMVVREEASSVSRRHYHALINEAWKNLPEDAMQRYPTPEHLRKWALIKAGYRQERTHVCASKAEAIRLQSFVKPMDDYAVVLVQGAVITIYTARSQKGRSMDRETFQASKTAVLAILSELIGVELETLNRQAEHA